MADLTTTYRTPPRARFCAEVGRDSHSRTSRAHKGRPKIFLSRYIPGFKWVERVDIFGSNYIYYSIRYIFLRDKYLDSNWVYDLFQ